MLTEKFSAFFDTIGAEWVLWLLLLLSVISVAVMVERWLFFKRNEFDLEALNKKLVNSLRTGGGKEEARKIVKDVPGMAGGVLTAAIDAFDDGVGAVEEVIQANIALERTRYDKFVGVLGTLGNNAPFVGLFGTVIGIIKALAASSAGAEGKARTDMMMYAISEALVATAIGLAVAIPAVIAYNSFKNRTKSTAQRTEWLARNVLAYLKADVGVHKKASKKAGA